MDEGLRNGCDIWRWGESSQLGIFDHHHSYWEQTQSVFGVCAHASVKNGPPVCNPYFSEKGADKGHRAAVASSFVSLYLYVPVLTEQVATPTLLSSRCNPPTPASIFRHSGARGWEGRGKEKVVDMSILSGRSIRVRGNKDGEWEGRGGDGREKWERTSVCAPAVCNERRD